MPFNQAQITAAKANQDAAAHDQSQQVRLVAGPGTGKSSTIEERVRWLLAQGIQPANIYCVSFTRASALDLRQRVYNYCSTNGQPTANQVRVTTLHSLALRILRSAGLLHAYPVDPLVLDTWELETVFDAEFGHNSGFGKERREKIRLEHEAFWGTGQWGPPNYIPPNPPITPGERAQFTAFHGPRTQSYSCVLPGEIVRQCVSHIAAGTLNAAALLNLQELVVDEYQDLNSMDLQLVDSIASQGARLFVAGDDDQSIYSFRYASPAGIQGFTVKYPNSRSHVLSDCFRCTPAVLTTALSLIGANAQPNRILKNTISLYANATPPLSGILHRWQFPSGLGEARAIAESCRDLIASGINPRDILVLISNQRVLLPLFNIEFQNAQVDYEPPRAEGFLDSNAGRFVLAIMRIVCEPNDYIAHRVVLGLRPGVGIATCSAITDAVIANNLNYRSLFYQAAPVGVFKSRAATALNHAQSVCSQIHTWQPIDTLATRLNDITSIIQAVFDPSDVQSWQAYAGVLPAGMSLQELRDFLWADTDEQQSALLNAVFNRLAIPIPPNGVLPPRVRVMSMHGAKGLSAKIVFIHGLEEDILPGPWRQPYPGLVLEAARLLYVSITRARAACIISYARTRIVHGQFQNHPASRFATQLAGAFLPKASGLNQVEVQDILNEVARL
jgi:DNA helicase-2/ATP-dependent DNA helicase PcrA